MDPFSTHGSLGIAVPSVALSHTPVPSLADGLRLTAQPNQLQILISTSPEGLGRIFPPSPASLGRALDFPVIAKILLTLSLRAWEREVCYGETSLLWRSQIAFFHPEHSLVVPPPPSCPFLCPSQAGSKHHGVFSPLQQMFHLLLLGL